MLKSMTCVDGGSGRPEILVRFDNRRERILDII